MIETRVNNIKVTSNNSKFVIIWQLGNMVALNNQYIDG